MQQKTIDLIRELEKDYNVKVEGENFLIDNLTFTEWKDGDLLVTYYDKNGYRDWKGDPEYDLVDEPIAHDIDEVHWWIKDRSDY
jgi:hypothetical protein